MTSSPPLSIPFLSVDEGDRARKEYGDLAGITNSISEIGLIQPLVLAKKADGEGYLLIAGGRRYRSLKALGTTELFHASTTTKGKPGFIFPDEVTESDRLEAELHENIFRLGMTWMEEVLLTKKIHDAKLRQARAMPGTSWNAKQTADVVGISPSWVSRHLVMAQAIESGDKEILACETQTQAYQVLVRRREEEALAEVNRRIGERRGQLPASSVSPAKPEDLLGSFSLDTTAPSVPSAPDVNAAVALISAPPVETRPRVQIDLSSLFSHGDCITVMASRPPASYHHIVTDIPYGIDMDNLTGNVADVADEHEVQANLELMEPFLRESFRLLKPGGFCVFFFDLDHWNHLQAVGKAIGFRVQDWPFIACKTSSCRNNAPAYNLTKNYEACAFFRKDSSSVLRKPVLSSWKAYDFATDRRLYNNKFAKPFELWKDIFSYIAFPGQSVLDPFCGEMSSCRAAVNCGLIPYGIEISEKHYHRGLENMKKVFAAAHNSNVEFI